MRINHEETKGTKKKIRKNLRALRFFVVDSPRRSVERFMKKATLLFLFTSCLIGGMMTPAAGRKAAPAIRVAPDRALVDEVVSVSISGLSQGQAATVKATLNDNHGV
jgi:hypothetical protein